MTNRHVAVPAPAVLQQAESLLASQAPRADPPAWWASTGIPAFHDVAHVVLEMNPDANAGHPYSQDGLKKQAWAEANIEVFVSLVQMRIAALGSVDPADLRLRTPRECVDACLVDPFAVIEKNDPHSEAKLASGMHRLVLCASVVDEAVDRLLFGAMHKAFAAEWGQFWSCIGVGFDDEDVVRVVECFERVAGGPGCPLVSSDVQGFEYSRQSWHFEAFARLWCSVHGMPSDCWVSRVVVARLILLSKGVYVFTDGLVLEQIVDGWQKSGCFITSDFNTATRSLDAFAVGLMSGAHKSVAAAGDDAGETPSPQLVEAYASLGVTIKEFKVESSSSFKFCSHQFSESGPPVPLNAPKAFFKLMAEGCGPAEFRQVVTQFFRSAETPRFLEVFKRAGRPFVKRLDKVDED